MGKINVLSFAVANLIAAGEVVDRPASAIKELMENAIDSGADRITVEIQNGGVTFMRVTDNGCGMEKDDLSMAIRRHATSKIHDEKDLNGIITLGFRGEALAAISAVSDIRIISKTAASEFGAMLEAHNGDIVGVTERGCADGTSVIVENLFANVPARRKFLKKDTTEAMAVTATVEKVALSRPDISFRLIIDGNIKLETAGDGNLKNTVYSLFGKEFTRGLIEVSGESEGVGIHGFIGRTDNVKATRNYQNFFINGRYVKSRTAQAAIEQAYCSYIPAEKFPCCVLFITLNPAIVDVNVHPAKLEVKFANERPVFEAVYYSVRSALEENVSRPDLKIGAKTDGQDGIDISGHKSGFGARMSDAFVPVPNGRQESMAKRQININEDYAANASERKPEQLRMTAQEYASRYLQDTKAQNPVGTASVERFESGVRQTARSETAQESLKNTTRLSQSVPQVGNVGTTQTVGVPAQTVQSTPQSVNSTPHTNQAAEPQSIGKSEKVGEGEIGKNNVRSSVRTDMPIPTYRIVGEVFNSYVIVELEDKMLLIDKHAAHERVIFEKLKANMKNAERASQMLMLPVEVMLTSDEIEILREYSADVEAVGFTFSAGKHIVNVLSIPDGIETDAVADMIMTIVDRIKHSTGSAQLTHDIIFEKALYQASCKAAVKAGREYPKEYVEWLVACLMRCPDITFCPHGRPVALEMSHKNLDRQFERT